MTIPSVTNDEIKKAIGQSIRFWREKKKLSQVELASMVGVKKAAISHIESGKNYPSVDRLIEIASKLDVQASLLMQGSYSLNTQVSNKEDIDLTVYFQNSKSNIYYVPNPAQAGIYRGVFDYQHQNLQKAYIPGFESGDSDKFLFHVEGESMYPFLSNGDMVIAVKLNSSEEIKPGFAYVICTREMLVVKRIQRLDEPNQLMLISDNREVQEPYKQHVDDITNIFLVKGAITTNTSKRFVLR